MQPDPPPADYLVTRTGPVGMAIIATCRAHLSHTRAVLQLGDPAARVEVSPANMDSDGQPRAVPIHGCKGHMEDWPTTIS